MLFFHSNRHTTLVIWCFRFLWMRCFALMTSLNVLQNLHFGTVYMLIISDFTVQKRSIYISYFYFVFQIWKLDISELRNPLRNSINSGFLVMIGHLFLSFFKQFPILFTNIQQNDLQKHWPSSLDSKFYFFEILFKFAQISHSFRGFEICTWKINSKKCSKWFKIVSIPGLFS